jgi:hypothetical protein
MSDQPLAAVQDLTFAEVADGPEAEGSPTHVAERSKAKSGSPSRGLDRLIRRSWYKFWSDITE